MNARKIKFYQTMLFHYVALYLVLQLLAALYFFALERGWGGFAYLWIFGPHLPLFLVASLVALLGKKRQQSTVWLVTLILFILSNAWWIYSGLQGGAYISYLIPIILTIIPIFATTKLMLLTTTEETKLPKV